MFSFELLLDAVVLGVLLGCFYAAVSLGLSVSFGLLDVPHVAHPAFLVVASYAVYVLNEHYGIDPLLAGLLITPFLFVFGLAAYRLYYETFEKRGSDAGVRGIAFFFGVAFIIEVLIILQFGVDQRSVTATYIGKAWRLGDMRIPFRLVVAFAVAAVLTILLSLYLSKTFMGRAIRAVAQDQEALRLMGANPIRIKQWAFGIATAVLGIAGALLIIVAPVDPTLDRAYIGRTFCVVVMAGLGSMTGTLVAAIILGVAESIVLTLYLSRTFMGRAIRAVAQDQEALRLMGVNPIKVKQWAFGIATAVLGIAGALLIIVAPVEPTLDRAYIGRTFCVVVMAGLGSMSGTIVAAIILGVAESIVLTSFGASWAPAISFAMLLGVLAVRPQGLFGRRS